MMDRIAELEAQYNTVLEWNIELEAEVARLNSCPWCGQPMERIPVDGGVELGCTSEKCPSFGIGVWCYAEKLRSALEEYGRHLEGCPLSRPGNAYAIAFNICTCGFEQTLEDKE